MSVNFKESIKNRRSYYQISKESPITDEQIEDIIKFAVKHVPSAFNSQSTRLVLLLNDSHDKLWDITKETLRKIVPEDSFSDTENKIEGSFKSGYGTVLFFEDQEVVKDLQEQFPLYEDKFPTWSEHTSAMHQFAIWNMLENEGFGASLQHYNPIIDDDVKKEWNIDSSWELKAQMPFGKPVAEPGDKEFESIEKRVKIFK